MLNYNYRVEIHRLYKKMNYCNLELPNGAKCNAEFYDLAISLGCIIDEDWI